GLGMLDWRAGRRTQWLVAGWLGLSAPAVAPVASPVRATRASSAPKRRGPSLSAADALKLLAFTSADGYGFDLPGLGYPRLTDFASLTDFVSYVSQTMSLDDASGGGDLGVRERLERGGDAHSQGDEVSGEAFLSAIYTEFSGAIHTYAFRLLGNREDADDVTQEVFIRAHAHMAQLRDQGRLRPWLYRIATNLCMDQLRKRSRVRRILGMETSLTPDDDDENGPHREVAQPGATSALEGVAERDHIARALKRMPVKYATCLLLHSQQGLSYREIAEALGVTPGAAAVRLSRARNLFAKHYDELREEGAR
ncbi:MAG TPA: RNA polymerase sigma factor, partial [Ktedonobacterales bacterium]|nr:RNA polymerase sigma factor [Ktedonobacterales bacterium]